MFTGLIKSGEFMSYICDCGLFPPELLVELLLLPPPPVNVCDGACCETNRPADTGISTLLGPIGMFGIGASTKWCRTGGEISFC